MIHINNGGSLCVNWIRRLEMFVVLCVKLGISNFLDPVIQIIIKSIFYFSHTSFYSSKGFLFFFFFKGIFYCYILVFWFYRVSVRY